MKSSLKVIVGLILTVLILGVFYFFSASKKEEVAAPVQTESNLFSQAQVEANKGNHVEALKAFEELLKKDPKHTTAMRFMLESYVQTNNAPKAFETINKIIELDPTPQSYEMAVSAAIRLNDKPRADSYRKLLEKSRAAKKSTK